MVSTLFGYFSTMFNSFSTIMDFLSMEIDTTFLKLGNIFGGGMLFPYAWVLPDSVSLFELMFGGAIFMFLILTIVKWVIGIIQ